MSHPLQGLVRSSWLMAGPAIGFGLALVVGPRSALDLGRHHRRKSAEARPDQGLPSRRSTVPRSDSMPPISGRAGLPWASTRLDGRLETASLHWPRPDGAMMAVWTTAPH